MKYRLIKWYPSLPEVWKESQVVVKPDTSFKFNDKPVHHIDKDGNTVGRKEVENNPEFWEKVKQPLFTTEDGVDIYEGMRTVYVPDYKFRCINNANAASVAKEIKINKYAVFAEKENAEEYVEENKLRYSKKEVREAIENSKLNRLNVLEKQLKKELDL